MHCAALARRARPEVVKPKVGRNTQVSQPIGNVQTQWNGEPVPIRGSRRCRRFSSFMLPSNRRVTSQLVRPGGRKISVAATLPNVAFMQQIVRSASARWSTATGLRHPHPQDDGAASAAREAVAIAKASRVARDKAVEWPPSPIIADGAWKHANCKQYVA